MFGDHGLGGLLKEGAHGKSPKCLGGNLGDFGEFCKGLKHLESPTAFLPSKGRLKSLLKRNRLAIELTKIFKINSYETIN